jgi:hypothetical protein
MYCTTSDSWPPPPRRCAGRSRIAAERVAWLQTSARTDEAAGRCGWEVAEFEKAAREHGIASGRFGRWALQGVERLAGNEVLEADLRAARMLGPELAAQHLEIRRLDLDYCIEAGWLMPVSHVRRTVWSGAARHHNVVDVPMYRVGDLDALRDIPGVDWEAVRATKPGRLSPLRASAQRRRSGPPPSAPSSTNYGRPSGCRCGLASPTSTTAGWSTGSRAWRAGRVREG